MLLLLALSCAAPPEPAEPVFVRRGVLLTSGEGRPVGGGRVLVERDWKPGEAVAGATAPAMAECVALYSVPLGDVSRLVARGGEAPDTALAFSPDGAWLAVGSYTGEVVVVDAWTGVVRARRRLPEALVKAVAWSGDGAVLYAAEQSPDALVHALDPTDLSSRWTVRLADHVGSSPAPAGDDLYGVYTLPFPSGLFVLEGGDVLVAAAHGWDDGARRNASRLLRLSPAGALVAAWPEDGPAPVVFKVPRVRGDLVAVPIGQSAEAPTDLPVNGVQLLDTALRPVRAIVAEPLAPHFTSVFLWESVDVGAGQVLLGHADGRLQLWPIEGGPPREIALGTPVVASDVPISASIGHAAFAGERVIALTSRTNIPYGAAAPELRPPAAHPNENAVWVYGPDATLRWTWHGAHAVQGFTVQGDTLVVGAGERLIDHRADLFGALVFDLAGGGSGEQRLRAVCPTEGPVFFRQAVAPDGRIAVAEYPFSREDGTLAGAYRVTVLR